MWPALYEHPPGSAAIDAGRPLLKNAAGGFVAVDAPLVWLWRAAAGRTPLQVIIGLLPPPELYGIVPEALACLAEGGLLVRIPERPRRAPAARPLNSSPAVVAIVVVSSPQELQWLESCLRSLLEQYFCLRGIIVVDNAAGPDLTAWTVARSLRVDVQSRATRAPLARALNDAIGTRPDADYYFLLNADVNVDRAAVGNMVARAVDRDNCAAVAPKLKFWRAPGFLNGIGNRVSDRGWGTDNAIGELDLGQADHWTEAPSACLAATLVNRRAWQDVGPFDTGYPAYYEDVDWSYRARLLGYRIGAAPDAEALHVFGGNWTPEAGTPSMTSAKLETAVIGRMRFAMKIPATPLRRRMLRQYLREDARNYREARRNGAVDVARAYVSAARSLARMLRDLAAERRRIQTRRVCDDSAIFIDEVALPPSMTWHNLPELTCEAIRKYYWPLIRAGRTRRLPESEALPSI